MASSGGLASILSDLTKQKGAKKSRKGPTKQKTVKHVQLGLTPSVPTAFEETDHRAMPSHLATSVGASRSVPNCLGVSELVNRNPHSAQETARICRRFRAASVLAAPYKLFGLIK